MYGAGASAAAGSAMPTTVSVPQYGAGAEVPKKKPDAAGGMMGGMGGGGGGGTAHSLPSQRPIGEHPETPEHELDRPGGMREGFARLAEIPARQRTYGTP